MQKENAYSRYRKKTLFRLQMDINRNTDADIIAWIERQTNVSGAIKNAIREHIRFSETDPPGIAPEFGNGGDKK